MRRNANSVRLDFKSPAASSLRATVAGRRRGPRRGLLLAGVAALFPLGVAAAWLAVGPRPDPELAATTTSDRLAGAVTTADARPARQAPAHRDAIALPPAEAQPAQAVPGDDDAGTATRAPATAGERSVLALPAVSRTRPGDPSSILAAPGVERGAAGAALAAFRPAAAGPTTPPEAATPAETAQRTEPVSAPAAPPQTPPAAATDEDDDTVTDRVAAVADAGVTALAPAPAPVTATADGGPEAAEALTLVVRSGDSLDRLFRRNDLSVGDLHAMLAVETAREGLRLVRPGDEIHIRRSGEQVLSLSRRLDDFRVLAVDRGADGYRAAIETDLPERRVVHAAGRITSSLFNAGRAAGVSDTLVMQLAGIFAWDIDFVLDIRQGDEFTVLYEELWRDGVKLRDGAILAAEFVNAGHTYRALRYVNPEGDDDYYTPDGHSLRKAFLRAPVDFSRISSNFNLNRRHPVLNTIRAHRGVDYAAPSGTPIKAAGDGKVVFRGVKGGYGNVVILQHGENIKTLYAHMSRFGRHGQGARVRQGDIIGYVGKSGLATGPHLHYEYQVAGVHRNPRTVELPKALPVQDAWRSDFLTHAAHVLAQLDLVKAVRLAAVDTTTGGSAGPGAAGGSP